MKRVFVSLALVLALAAAAFGAAAALNVDGGVIQAGADTNLQCDTDGVRVAGWGLETDTGLVDFVRIHDINPGCEGAELFVNITQNGTKIAEGSATIPSDGAGGDNDLDPNEVGVKVDFEPDQPAADITDIEVFIEGGN
ncbi:hypothetical protein NET02_01295 [Thermomicrobiaceae bacterium CFH 74404]|uniref:Uncharacterized protein n=1 Tax=Thermalbibacter longus TaxID=2951981 RepID=A0AA41W9L2_9BACT|nr:hypothetical protein [Thermalbibacter longus]MCM8747777.1 hypothetical protein [Thermalbibacter longus]